MLKRIVVAIMIVFFAARSAGADTGERKENSLFEALKKPFYFILKPVRGEKLVDAIIDPLNNVACPLASFGEPVVTPGRTEEYIYNLNRNVDVITSKDISDMNAKTVQEALAARAAIVTNAFFNNPKDNSLDMRGFGSAANLNYLVMVDGRRINQVDLSGPDLAQVDISTVERIEVVKGPNTVLYGDNATGGVINIITKKGVPDHHARYEQQFGSYRYNRESFSFDGRKTPVDYYFSASWQDSDGYRLNNSYEANDIFTSIALEPAKDVGLNFSSGYHRDWYGQPGALYDGNIQSDGREGSRFPDSKAKTEESYFTVEPRASLEAGHSDISVVVPFTYRLRRANALDVGFNRYETDHHINSLDLRPKCEVASTFADGTLQNKLVLGVDLLDVEDQVLSGDVTFTKSQVDITKRTAALYVSDNMLVNDRLTANCGIRGEWAEYYFDQKMPAYSQSEKSLRDVAFDAGVGYKYNKRSQVYALYARSYRFPTTDEFYQSAYESFDWTSWSVRVFPAMLSDLKQQTANNYEVGVKDNTFENLRLRAAYYFMDTKNEIYYDPVDFTNENYRRTFRHGLETEAEIVLFSRLSGSINYTFQRSTFKGDKYGGYSIPLVPENVLSAGVRIEPIDRLVLELNFNYVGDMVIGNDPKADSSPLEARNTMDLSASYEFMYFRAFIVARNLAGARYFSNATRNFLGNTAFYPAPGRSVEAGVAIRF